MVLNPDPCSKKRTPKYLSNGQMDLFLSFCISDFDWTTKLLVLTRQQYLHIIAYTVGVN